jgi:AcrR family transcriptional regulator
MARVDLVRRAQIGLRRREKRRSQLVQAARALISTRPVDAITVEQVANKAGVAKGTFYAHFENLDAMRAAVTEELTNEFHGLFEPDSAAIADPVERIANGCAAFITQALRNPAWGGLTARGIWAFPAVAKAVHTRLDEDLRCAIAEKRLASISAEVAFDIVVGVVLQAMRSASEKKLWSDDVPVIVSAVLRALGVRADQASQIARRIFELQYPDADRCPPPQQIELNDDNQGDEHAD